MERKRRKGIKLTEGKRNIIASLIQEYDIQSTQDIQEALKDLLGGTIQEMFEATKKWTSSLRNWGRIYGELQIMFEDRFLD